MDNRAWSSGASASPPSAPASPSMGYPTPGDPQTATPATKGGAFWFHMIGEELRAVLTAAGITPSTANNAQLLEAIQRLIDAQSGNYALDTGAANAYMVALSPAITAYTDGMTVRVKAVNANTGASTLNAGGGAVSLVNDVGGALAAGDIPANSIFTATYITSANKFYITSMVQSQGDALYAALAGLATQVFSVATPNAAAHAVRADSVMGYKNQITNGCCRIAQRPSVTVNGAAQLGMVDRIWFQCSGTGVSGATAQVTGRPTASGFMTGISGLNCTGGIPYASLRLRGRDTMCLNSKTVTFSALVSHSQGANQTYTIKIYRPTTTVDVFSALTLIGSMTMTVSAVPSGGYTRIAGTYTFGAGDCGNGLYFEIAPNAAANWAAADLFFGDLQLEVGSVATPFELRPYSFEKQLCQAYRCMTYSDGVLPGTVTNVGSQLMVPVGAASGYAVGNFKFPVTMRAIPTITFYSPSNGATGNWYRSAGSANTTVAVSGNAGVSTEGVGYNNTSATVTTGEQIYGHIVADAEL